MACWRQLLLAIVTGSLLIGGLGGCTPASNSPLNEEKDPYVEQGRKRESGYDFSGAIESYHRALEVNPRNSLAHYRLGLLYEREDRDPAAAIHHFQRFLTLRPNSENGAMIRQHILGCKQALAKDVALGPVSGEMKRRLDELLQTNQTLEDENRRLKEQVARLQSGLAADTAAPTLSPGSRAKPSAPPTTATSPPTASAHTVQKGDTYYSIARRYGVSTASLQAANPGVNPTRLKIGQQLRVPSR